MTFGITPTRAETGYGYIRAGAPLPAAPAVLRVARFVEKPQRPAAEAMLAEGGHYWNSGMFLFRAERILAELGAHAPAILAAVEDAFAALAEAPGGAFEVPLARYAGGAGRADRQGGDGALAADRGRAVRSRLVRSRLLAGALGAAAQGWRGQRGPGRRPARRQRRTAWSMPRGAWSRARACEDLAVVATDDAILVAGRSRGDAVRQLVGLLKAAGRPEASAHATEQRPWGSFRVLHEGPGCKVKEIIVAPGGRLSLQSHRHRAEHWVVVAGTARVTVDERILLLEPNQSVHIPLGARHRMENPGALPMHLIEVQCGSYLGEDDIIRYEDVYGRS